MQSYNNLIEAIQASNQGENSITIKLGDEFYQGEYNLVLGDDRLDENHLVINFVNSEEKPCQDI